MKLRTLTRCLLITLGILQPLWADTPTQQMVGLLARATLESSRHDCRFGIYRMSARNYQYLDAVLTGLSAGKLAGVAEGLKATRGQRNEIARLALYSLAFAGNAPDALELGQQLLASPEPGVQDRIWIRLALAEAAREAWRAEVLDAQLAALQPQALAGLAGFLVFSLQAERRAQLQTFPWEQALSDYRKARARLEAAGPDQKWPVGSGHFLAQAQCAWSEILTQSAQTPEQQAEAEKCLEELRGRFSQSSNPEVLQALLFAHLERLSQERALEKWERCLTDLNAIQSALERLASLSEQASKAEKQDFSQRASQIKKLALSHKELSDSGLHLMADNLAPGDPAVGELARLECTYYREWARVLIYGPDSNPERLKKARMCLEVAGLRQLLTSLTQSPLATLDLPVFDWVELELRQRPEGWQKRAQELADGAVAYFVREKSLPGEVMALTVQAEVYLAQDGLESARKALQRAIDLAEKHVVESGFTGNWAQRFRQRFAKAYELLLRLEIQAGNPQAAANLLGRFQDLQVSFRRSSSLLGAALPAPLPRLRGGNQPISQALPEDLPADASSSAVANGKAEFFRTLSQLRQKHKEYESLLAVRPVNYAQLQKLIPPDTAILQYFPAGDGLYLFFVTQRDFGIRRVEIGAAGLRQKVAAMRAAISDLSPRGEARFQAASQDLYSCLIGPVEGELAGYAQVAFVPTSHLCYVPFGALGRIEQDGQFHYLVEKRACMELVKSSDLDNLARQAVSTRGSVLALGNPDGSLPAAGQEAERVAGLFKGSFSYVGAAASKERLASLPRGVRFLHLATHGVLDSANPGQSYLVMGNQGRLAVSDIYGLTLPEVRLVTLSACQTALADLDPGSEISSLADAFGVAGASSVVASLWSVEDRATQKLMLAFYGQIRQGQSLAQALRHAQQEMLADPQFRHPFFWGAFGLFGDWR